MTLYAANKYFKNCFFSLQFFDNYETCLPCSWVDQGDKPCHNLLINKNVYHDFGVAKSERVSTHRGTTITESSRHILGLCKNKLLIVFDCSFWSFIILFLVYMFVDLITAFFTVESTYSELVLGRSFTLPSKSVFVVAVAVALPRLGTG